MEAQEVFHSKCALVVYGIIFDYSTGHFLVCIQYKHKNDTHAAWGGNVEGCIEHLQGIASDSTIVGPYRQKKVNFAISRNTTPELIGEHLANNRKDNPFGWVVFGEDWVEAAKAIKWANALEVQP